MMKRTAVVDYGIDYGLHNMHGTAGVSTTGFPRRNWIIVILLRGLVFTGYTITISSMHQYITTPSMEQLAASNNTDSGVIPGFGKSEVFYMWAVVMYSIGELVGAFSVPFLSKFLPYRTSLSIGTFACLVDFLCYSLAPTAWFILVARFFGGINCGVLLPLISTYLAETSAEVYQRQLELERLQRADDDSTKSELAGTVNPLRDKLFTALTFAASGSNILLLGIGPLIVMIKGMNPYTWPGWVMLPFSTLMLLMFLFVFKEHKARASMSDLTTSSGGLKLTTTKTLRPRWRLHIYALLILYFYIASFGHAFLDTLLNPMLSDHFGFRIKDLSYVVVATAIMFLLSSCLFLFLKRSGVNSRKIYITGLVMAIGGQLLMADWQALGFDSCREGFASNYSGSSILRTYVNVKNVSSDVTERRACELLSTDGNYCLWNQHSQVTGEYCSECLKVCRSARKSLNFVQFILGLVLYTATILLLGTTISVIISEVTPKPLMSTMMALGLVSGGASRLISPFWLDTTYRAAREHTHVPTAITATSLITVLIIFLATYKWLAPIAQDVREGWDSTTDKSDEEMELDNMVNGAGTYQQLECDETGEMEDCDNDSSVESKLPLLT